VDRVKLIWCPLGVRCRRVQQPDVLGYRARSRVVHAGVTLVPAIGSVINKVSISRVVETAAPIAYEAQKDLLTVGEATASVLLLVDIRMVRRGGRHRAILISQTSARTLASHLSLVSIHISSVVGSNTEEQCGCGHVLLGDIEVEVAHLQRPVSPSVPNVCCWAVESVSLCEVTNICRRVGSIERDRLDSI